MTIVPPSAAAFRTPASTSSAVRHTKTPFPAASPSALTTHGALATGRSAAAGTPAAAMTSLAKLFEPSILAACAPGPKTAIPAWRSSSPTPATSGASGPITTSSAPTVPARPRSPSPSSARTGWQFPSWAMPGFPGAACSSVSDALVASFQARACSRAPEPTRSTLTVRRVYFAECRIPEGSHGASTRQRP